MEYVDLGRLNYISQNPPSYMFPVRISHQGDSCVRLGGRT